MKANNGASPLFKRCLALLGLMLALLPAAHADDAIAGTWEGDYVCGQGDTALTLILRLGDRKDGIDGMFRFGASATNPGVPDGCFTMTGTYDGQTRTMRLSAGHWLLHPFGYVSVGLVGQLAPGGDSLSGTVIGPLCRGFDLHRVSGPQTVLPSACGESAAVAAVR